MTDRPIIFSTPMILALLAGRKSQTRRVLKPQPPAETTVYMPAGSDLWLWADGKGAAETVPLRYATGDRLYVREGHKLIDRHVDYRADWCAADQRRFWWRPSIHMPRWASRLTLTVTDVRVQRLQEISEEDAIAEGLLVGVACDCAERELPVYAWPPSQTPFFSATAAFCWLWCTLHSPDAWDRNDWVCAISFTTEHRNIDA